MAIAVVAIVVVLLVFLVLGYNALVSKRNRTDNAWAQVDVQLRRRYDLIPNLVSTVKGYAAHEAQVFTDVTNARAGAEQAEGQADQAQAESVLDRALGRLLAVAEDYPELRASENFRQLQGDLSETENRITVARQIYNDTVLTYNNAVQQIPTNLLAALFSFKVREYFEIAGGDAARQPVAVEF